MNAKEIEQKQKEYNQAIEVFSDMLDAFDKRDQKRLNIIPEPLRRVIRRFNRPVRASMDIIHPPVKKLPIPVKVVEQPKKGIENQDDDFKGRINAMKATAADLLLLTPAEKTAYDKALKATSKTKGSGARKEPTKKAE